MCRLEKKQCRYADQKSPKILHFERLFSAGAYKMAPKKVTFLFCSTKKAI